MNNKTGFAHEHYRGRQDEKPTIMEDLFCKLCVALFVLLAVVALIS